MSRFFSILFLCCAGITFAQTDQANLSGVVTDTSSAVIPGVAIQLTNVQTGVSRQSITNDSGSYRFPYLPAGEYELRANLGGFESQRVQKIVLTVGLNATVDLVLRPGALQQEITISASSVQLEQESAAIGSVVGSQQLRELPLLGRDAFSLVLLSPGVLPGGIAASAAAGAVVNGGRSATNEILLDGAQTRSLAANSISYTPPVESVGEFKTITNNFSSEFGRTGGGVLTATTKSGTNEFHGALYEFFRNDKLSANG